MDKWITVKKCSKYNVDLVRCFKCDGYYSSLNFRRHVREKCGLEGAPYNVIGTSRILAAKLHPKACKELINDFFPNFTKVSQREIITKGRTVVCFANKLIQKYHISVNYAGKHTFIA